MTDPEALLQLARILGRDRLARRLGLSLGQPPPSLTPQQTTALRSQAEEHSQDIARALLGEAAACDDVTDAASALAYLEDRLAFLADLRAEEARSRVREGFSAVARRWG